MFLFTFHIIDCYTELQQYVLQQLTVNNHFIFLSTMLVSATNFESAVHVIFIIPS